MKNILPKGDTTNWYYKLYTVTDFINDTIPSYTNNLPKRYNEASLKTELTLNENGNVMKRSQSN